MQATDFSKAMTALLKDEVAFTAQARSLIGQISWREKEKEILQSISSGSVTLIEIFKKSSLTKGHTSALLWALLQLRFLSFTKKKVEEASGSRNNGERLVQKIRQIKKGNLFDVLEVHWICLPAEIDLAFKKLALEFEPQNSRWTPDDISRLNAINREIKSAHEQLSDDDRRRQYRSRLIKQQTILQSASLLGQKGQMAISKGSKREAILCFSKALELNPGHQDLMQGLQKASSL